MQHRMAFTASDLDRAAYLRDAPPAPGRVLALDDGGIAVHETGLAWHDPDDLPEGTDIFLGLLDGQPIHARRVGAAPPGTTFAALRDIMTRLSPAEAEAAVTARALFNWHDSHGFCARCGHPSDMVQAGWQRLCPACRRQHFPRTDPVVIMLVLDGDRLLLGRSALWRAGMFSCLAGFMEPGETPEAAVRREVLEETAIRTGEVRYLTSQPWPFPSSLMMGCVARAISTEITIDPVEIDAARWADRAEVMEALIGRHPDMALPQPGTIAHHLITRWLADRLD